MDKNLALIAAAERNDLVAVQRLLKEGGAVTARDGQGRTALLVATARNHVEIAGLLIEAGSDVNAQDKKQDSPLLLAGADVNLADGEGVTPLQHARQKGYREIAGILEKAGAR